MPIMKPMAGCPNCREPLVSSLETKFKEWVCVACGEWWEYLSPVSLPWTTELDERYTELKYLYIRGVRGPFLGGFPIDA